MAITAQSQLSITDYTDGDVPTLADWRTDFEENGEDVRVGGRYEDAHAYFAVGNPGIPAQLSVGTLANYAASMAGLGYTAAGVFLSLTGVGAPLGAIDLFFGASSIAQEAYSFYSINAELKAYNDPFDANYTSVYKLTIPLLAALPSSTGIPLGVVADVQAFERDGATIAGDSQAVYITEDRVSSAAQMGDQLSFDLQNNALNTYTDLLAAAHTAYAHDSAVLATDLQSNGFDIAIPQTQIAAFQAAIAKGGFSALPQQEQDIINSLGVTAADQAAIVASITAINPTAVPASYVAALQAASTVSASLAVMYANDAGKPTVGNFTVTDTTTNSTAINNGAAYTGPVSGLSNEYINITPDNLSIIGDVPSSFIHSGSGTDAIDVSNVGGTNVLDGSTGSNFLVGGTGGDTFFVDDRVATADIWSTISNFHSGDAVTVYGVTAANFQLDWEDGQGASNYTGLTLHATAAGKPIASMTLAGFTKSDLTNGHLTISFGSDPASASNYMYVHGN